MGDFCERNMSATFARINWFGLVKTDVLTFKKGYSRTEPTVPYLIGAKPLTP